MKIDYGNGDDNDDDELGYSVLNLISGLTISSAASVVFVAQRIHNTTTRRDVVDCATSCATNPQHLDVSSCCGFVARRAVQRIHNTTTTIRIGMRREHVSHPK